MLNNWSGQGRLVKDVELRYTANQTPVASFTLACERDYKPKEGERECDWIDVVAWKSSAEFVSKYFHKGDMVIVSGRIQTRMYEDRDNKKRKATEVVGTTFNFAGSKQQGSQQAAEPQGRMEQQNPYASAMQYQGGGQNSYDGFMSIPDGIDEELPFN